MCTTAPAGRKRGGVVWLLLFVASATLARTPEATKVSEQAAPVAPPTSCSNHQHIQISLGVPAQYVSQVLNSGEDPDPGKGPVCANIVSGSPYAILDWFEHGEVQAALMSQFAVRVMQADDAAAFDDEYQAFPAHALSIPQLFRRIALLDGTGGPVSREQLWAFFDSFSSADAHTIILPNHLSTAVAQLVALGASYIEEKQLGEQQRDIFFGHLIDAIRFRLYPDSIAGNTAARTLELAETFEKAQDLPEELQRKIRLTGNSTAGQACDMQNGIVCWTEDVLVVRRRLLDRLHGVQAQLQGHADEAKAAPPPGVAALFAQDMGAENSLGPRIREFREANYRRYRVGNLPQRYFRFSLDELWSVLAHEGAPPASPRPDKPHLALVLTGGGVKAAYQTRMIDDLYRDRRLMNGVDPPDDKSQRVDFVIGTSGGALLGVFVSALNEPLVDAFRSGRADNLTKIIWTEPGAGINSLQIFPFFDLPRYGTVLGVYVILMMVAWVPRAFRRWQERRGKVPPRDPTEPPPSSIGRGIESVAWYLLLIAAPFILVRACSFHVHEGMPPLTGGIYALLLVIALYADVRLRRKATFSRGTFVMSPAAWWYTALFAAGVLLVTLATKAGALDRFVFPAAGDNQPPVLAACLGVTALALALYGFFRSQKNVFELQQRAPIGRAFLIVAAIVVVTYLLLWLGALLRPVSFLELTGVFWVWFLPIAAALCIVVVCLAYSHAGGGTSARGRLRATFDYLFGKYRSWMGVLTARRYAAFIGLGFVGWVWWNLLAAPSLYSNHNAMAYFEGAFTRFSKVLEKAQPGPVVADVTRYPLKIPFVITATSLESERELYFLFLGKDEGAAASEVAAAPDSIRARTCARKPDEAADVGDYLAIDRQLNDTAWSNIASDSRWFVVRKARGCDLREAAFASGSPFPVFAAHSLDMEVLRTPEHLIDGGFAHNRPLEAARVLNASKVLVINSSPLEAGTASARCHLLFRMGELACNLPKLVPYLWDRSQIEDVLSTRNMLVASIYPSPDSTAWPLLTDFRREVVKRLVQRAQDDGTQRVGVIESWGRRMAPGKDSSRLLQYDRTLIR